MHHTIYLTRFTAMPYSEQTHKYREYAHRETRTWFEPARPAVKLPSRLSMWFTFDGQNLGNDSSETLEKVTNRKMEDAAR